ncbi:trehalose utilization protein ThuA [Candidatus Poribacteria bacterium]|nr:trehalose utilization protein ThuA [Candidatus Poribacteria bacterium]
MSDKIRVLAWSEVTEPKYAYPNGIHGALAEYLNVCEGITAKTASINGPDQGVSEDALNETDVLIWFGHVRHGNITDETVNRIVRHVKERGMGFLALHSSHFARPYKALMGTNCGWRAYVEDGKSGHIKVVKKDHPIAKGVSDFTIPREEWYGEPFEVPEPEAVIIKGTYKDGEEVARDLLVWTVGKGRVAYFRPGHETFPIYYMAEVRKLIENSVRWLAKKV